MGIFGSLGSAICSGIKSIGSALSSGIKTIGKAIKSAMDVALKVAKQVATSALGKAVLRLLEPLAKLATGVLGPVLGPVVAHLIIQAIIETLLKKVTEAENEQVDEIGYRVDEAGKHEDWKKPEDFKSFKDYYEYLKEQIPDDQIDRKQLEEKQYYYKAAGIDTLAKEVGRTEGIETPLDFFVEVARSRMGENEVQAIIDAYKKLGHPIVSLHDFLQGKVSPADAGKVRKALLSSLKKYYPEKDMDSLKQRLFIMEKCSKDDLFMVKNSYLKELDDINDNGKASSCL